MRSHFHLSLSLYLPLIIDKCSPGSEGAIFLRYKAREWAS